ncbi:MAG: VWA domain-containing protein [Oligoflexales bacterium]|nr:VWA domain-containing protein [Oligoflexales bacterium]
MRVNSLILRIKLLLAIIFIPFISACSQDNSNNNVEPIPFIAGDSDSLGIEGGVNILAIEDRDAQSSPVFVKTIKQESDLLNIEEFFFSSDEVSLQEKTTTYFQANQVKPAIDILFVIDNSGSMKDEQANLSKKLFALLSFLKSVEWQINIITTDSSCPNPSHTQLPLNSNMRDEEVDKLFKDYANVGIGGAGDERGISMAIGNILGEARGKCSGAPPAWMREGSKLAIIFVTDEEEGGVGSATSYGAPKTAGTNKQDKEDLRIALEKINRVPGDDARVYGLLNLGVESKSCSTENLISKTYIDLIDDYQGMYGNICSSDYSNILTEISQEIGFLLNMIIQLEAAPVASSINVFTLSTALSYVSEVEIKESGAFFADWILIDDKVVLSRPLDANTLLVIKYKISKLRTLVVDKVLKGTEEINVYFGGKLLLKNRYRVISLENAIYFFEDLPLDEKILITISTPAELKSSFAFPEVESENIQCYVGEKLIKHNYSISKQHISFDELLKSGTEVFCLYR